MIEITIKGELKEDTALVLVVQERQYTERELTKMTVQLFIQTFATIHDKSEEFPSL